MTSRLINGLVLIVVGAILLMNTTGNLPWGVWDAALKYWPVALIGLGLQLALHKWHFPGFAIALVIILILAAMNPYRGPSAIFRNWPWLRHISPSTMPGRTKTWSVPLRPITSRLDINLQAPSLELEARGDPGLNSVEPALALSSTLSWDGLEPQSACDEIGGGETLKITMGTPSTSSSDAGRQYWQVALNPSLATSVNVTGGVANLTLDLRSVCLESLNLSSGVTSLDLTLGLSGKETSVQVAGGVADVNLTVPETAGIKITVKGPLAMSNDFAGQGLVRSGDVWSTPNYVSASTRVDVRVSCAGGKVTLKRVAWE